MFCPLPPFNVVLIYNQWNMFITVAAQKKMWLISDVSAMVWKMYMDAGGVYYRCFYINFIY